MLAVQFIFLWLRLISNMFPLAYFGSKKKYLNEIMQISGHDPSDFTQVVEPFTGAARVTAEFLDQNPAANVVWGETDITMLALQQLYANQLNTYKLIKAEVSKQAREWLDYILSHDQDDSTEKFRDFYAESANETDRYKRLKKLALCAIIAHKWTYNGCLRLSLNGTPNVKIAKERAQTAKANWQWEWPTKPKGCSVLPTSSYQQAIAQIKRNSFVLIDPPYYVEKGEFAKVTPCYPGHLPHDPKTLEMSLDAVELALKRNPKLLVVTVYNGRAMREGIMTLAEKHFQLCSIHTKGDGHLTRSAALGRGGEAKRKGNYQNGNRTSKSKLPRAKEAIFVIKPPVQCSILGLLQAS